MIEITLEDLSTRYNLVCRFCLSESECFPLFLCDGNINKRLQKGIEIIATKVDENDGLPNNICNMCLQVIEDFVDFEANCSKSYEILLKCITDSIDVEGNDKQSNEEVSMEDIEPSDCIDHDHAEVPEIVADDEQIAESLHLTVDEERNIQALQIITDKREESNTRSAKVSTKVSRNKLETPATGVENEVSRTISIQQTTVNSVTEEMCITASNATVVDYYHRKNKKIPIVQCMFCDRTYRGRNTLRKHLKIHFQIKNYVCSHCERNFSDRTSLRVHEARHSATKSFQCDHCDRAYYSQIELNQHCLAKHEGRKYACVLCNKKFPSKTILQDHASVHKSDRPFVCCTCGKSFKRNRNLVRHYQSHEKADSVTQSEAANRSINAVSCQYCDNVFKKPSKLLEHLIQTHPAEYEQNRIGTHYCSNCSSNFDDLQDYLLHQDEHNLLVFTAGGNTVYQCVDCGKQLRYRSLAEKHLRSHSTERRFQCNVTECLKKYKFKVHLTRHMRLAHGQYGQL